VWERMTQFDWSGLEQALGTVLVTAHALLVLTVSVRVVLKRRAIGVSLAWLAMIYAVPFVGVAFYLLLGEMNLGKKRALRARQMFTPYLDWVTRFKALLPLQTCQVSELAQPTHDYVVGRLGMPSVAGNQLVLLSRPAEILQDLVREIELAGESCYMEFYIWYPGGSADEVGWALMAAARRGVDCRVMLDSVGSATFFKSQWPGRLLAAGVRLVEVLPVGTLRMFFERQDLRMHRKLVVIDQAVAYTGSMNLVDPRYFKQHIGVGQWVDVMVKIRGPVLPLLWSLLVWDWEMETGERLLDSARSGHNEPDSCQNRVQPIPSGPYRFDNTVHQVLLTATYSARRTLVLTTPYFVPDEDLMGALCAAAQRGVEVQIILPARNDSMMVRFACRSFFDELLAAGVQIYRFYGGLLHTKSVVVDGSLALVGTLNLDRRSVWLNFEITLLVDDREFADKMSRLQRYYISRSQPLDPDQWRARPWYRRLPENLFYLFSPLL